MTGRTPPGRRRLAGRLLVAVAATALLLGGVLSGSAAAVETGPPDACAGTAVDRPECLPPEQDDDGGLFDGLLGSAGERATQMLSRWAAQGAVWLLSGIASALDRTGDPHVTAAYFVSHYERMAGVGMLLMIPLLCIALGRAAIRADAALAAKAVLLYTPLAIAGMLGAVATVVVLLDVVDWATAAVVGDVGESAGRFVEAMTRRLLGVGGSAGAGIGAFLFGLVTAVFSLVLWVELVIRARAIEVAVLFLPLGFAALVWPATARWCSRLLRTVAALILAEPVIVAVIVLGAGALGGPSAEGAEPGKHLASGTDDSAGAGGLIAGVSMLAFGCLAPWGLWHLLSPVEGATDSAVEGVVRRPTAAVDVNRGRHSAAHVAVQALHARRAATAGRTVVAGAGGPAAAAGAAAATAAAKGAGAARRVPGRSVEQTVTAAGRAGGSQGPPAPGGSGAVPSPSTPPAPSPPSQHPPAAGRGPGHFPRPPKRLPRRLPNPAQRQGPPDGAPGLRRPPPTRPPRRRLN